MAKRVGLYVNPTKINPDTLPSQLTAWFKQQGWETVFDWQYNRDVVQDLDFILSLGGDGTVLQAAREAAPFGIPVLGVNFGRLGFLCEVERDDIYSALKRVMSKEYSIEERMMMAASLTRSGKKMQYIVLNDVVFIREYPEHMITLEVKLSGQALASPPADGLIIATPTGSTAYSLSAGGPIVSPDVEAILITQISAHSLSSRPMIVSRHEKIDVAFTKGTTCRVTFDGGNMLIMNPGETIRVESIPLKAKFIRLTGRSFPKIVREKLRDRWHE
ncbi:MAG: NAD(+)/NADH kinase [Peptococcaceae bacterium]|jgi:NAD+ kinase|nr:NAD(+)/NADH kinase [Peptococcaceae bacterium]